MDRKKVLTLVRWMEMKLGAHYGQRCYVPIETLFSVAHLHRYGNPRSKVGTLQLHACIDLYNTKGVIPSFVHDYCKHIMFNEFTIIGGNK